MRIPNTSPTAVTGPSDTAPRTIPDPSNSTWRAGSARAGLIWVGSVTTVVTEPAQIAIWQGSRPERRAAQNAPMSEVGGDAQLGVGLRGAVEEVGGLAGGGGERQQL